MVYDITSLINDVFAAIASSGLTASVFYRLVKNGKLNFAAVKEVATGVEHIVEDIAKTPAYKVIDAGLHHELNKSQNQFEQSEIGRLALAALHGAESSYGDLSDPEKASVVNFIQCELQKYHIQVAESEVEVAIKEAEKFSEKFKSNEGYVQAKNFTQTLKNMKKAANQSVTSNTPEKQITSDQDPTASVTQ